MLRIEARNIEFSMNGESILPRNCCSQGISFKLEQGQSMLISGKSGSGKSTLFKLLSLEIIPTKGTLLFDDTDISKLSEARKVDFLKKIGLIFQDNLLIDNLNSYMNIAIPFIVNDNQIDHKKICSSMKLFDISHCEKKYVENLSGGEKKRIMICRGTINNPLVIIADEPISGLHEEMAKKIVEYLSELYKKGASVIITSHDSAGLEAISFSYVVNLNNMFKQI